MVFQIDKDSLSDKLKVDFKHDEEIKWMGEPVFKAHFFNELKGMFVGLLFIIGSILLFQVIAFLFKTTFDWINTIIFFGIVAVISISRSVWELLTLRKTIYVVTNLSIIIHNDFYSISTKVIHIKDIQTKEIKETFIDKYFGTGSVLIFTGETKEDDGKLEKVYDILHSIRETQTVAGLT